jgi:hypothetical protein
LALAVSRCGGEPKKNDPQNLQQEKAITCRAFGGPEATPALPQSVGGCDELQRRLSRKRIPPLDSTLPDFTAPDSTPVK